jgi:hypothetical protein
MALETALIQLPFGAGLAEDTDERLIPPGRWARLENLVCNKGGAFEKRYGFGEIIATSDTGTVEAPCFVVDFYGAPAFFSDPLLALPRVYQSASGSTRAVDRGLACPASMRAKNVGNRWVKPRSFARPREHASLRA